MTPADFLTKWAGVLGNERGNHQLFVTELCDLLGVPKPDPWSDDRDNAYCLEYRVERLDLDGTSHRNSLDAYRRGHFILEAKAAPRKGAKRGTPAHALRLREAAAQAVEYERALAKTEPPIPFLIIIDLGGSFDLYADFSKSRRGYQPFPRPGANRIPLADLTQEATRALLRQIWTDPYGLDPAAKAQAVTQAAASQLAGLVRALRAPGIERQTIATFLIRYFFCAFAEDIGLMKPHQFTEFLKRLRPAPANAHKSLTALWADLNAGGWSAVLGDEVAQINGGLFKDATALPLTGTQLELLIRTAEMRWDEVEPAIFGNVLEQALDAQERHSLGAHFTPRAYVELLVDHTVMDPLRQEWAEVRAVIDALVAADGPAMAGGAATKAAQDLIARFTGATKDQARHSKRSTKATAEDHALGLAQRLLDIFHRRLSAVRVLDPACGTGNFLYVALDLLKRLEAEVTALERDLGVATGRVDDLGINPRNFLGLEINPDAVPVAELVLWIGWLQWYRRTRPAGDTSWPKPVLHDYQQIRRQDALLAYDGTEPTGQTRWDGRSYIPSPTTSEPIPDPSARVPVLRYLNPRKATWPAADFVVGNPPFIGNKRLRLALGDGYVETLRQTWTDVPETADFVMYWWHHAAQLTRMQAIRRFGFITTNSITQTFNRRIVADFLDARPGAPRPGAPVPSPARKSLEADEGAGAPREDNTPTPWHSRGYLPHFDAPGTIQAITFRLADSLPADVVADLDRTCPDDDAERRTRIDHFLDAGHGSCLLNNGTYANIVQSVLLNRDGTDYRLLAWVIMPNHVHVLIEPLVPVPDIVQAWKSVSSHRIKAALKTVGVEPPKNLWQREYWDRYIRDERHYLQTLAYIANNPAKAGLDAWPWQGPGAPSPGAPAPSPARQRLDAGEGAGAPGRLIFAIPDHPWVDTEGGAAVRVAMTVADLGNEIGQLLTVTSERESVGEASTPIVTYHSASGRINSDLTIGADVTLAKPLAANENICFQGMNLVGEGFRITPAEADSLGRCPIIKPYQKAKNLLQGGDSGLVIDAYGLSAEDLQREYPAVYQHLYEHVKPERDENNRASRRNNWWLFGETVGKLRHALRGLTRYIAVVETSKHKPFVFLDAAIVPDHKLYAIASDDALHLGVLSSRIHLTWAEAAGGRLGVGNDPTWTNTTTFRPFPFPTPTTAQAARIRDLAEQLDAHRKRQQNAHPDLTLTGMYNVLTKLRNNESLNAKEQNIHTQGLVTVLRQLHDDLDAAVAAAYGWPVDLPEADILTRLVALNAQRAAEEKAGKIRWLRPEFQAPASTQAAPAKVPWPKPVAERMALVRARLTAARDGGLTLSALRTGFTGAKVGDLEDLLTTLATLGHARQADGRWYPL